MPQLNGHWDGFGWQTPKAAEVLEKPGRKKDRTNTLRGLATTVVRKLAELGAPVRLKNVEYFSSHTRYHLVPDKVGARGSERTITMQDLEKAMPEVLPDLNAQTVQLVSLNPAEPTITLFLRSPANSALTLHELMQQNAFTTSPAYTNIILGVDVSQQVVVQDLTRIKNLLVVGSANARLHLMLGIAVTLSIFNSPSYVRLALVGDETTLFRHFIGSPHVLGNIITSTGGFRRLMDGLTKHIGQRKQIFEDHNAPNLDEYNKMAISSKDIKPLPRIVVLLDTAALPDWRESQEKWMIPLAQILTKGADVGIHIVMTSPDVQSVPQQIGSAFTHRLILRSALGSQMKLPASVPLLFMDGILLAKDQAAPVPLELAAVSEAEVIRSVNYWQNMRNQRNATIQQKGQPIPTGNTGLLALRSDMLPTGSTQPTEPMPSSGESMIMVDHRLTASQALAAYLGWLSVGPLRDVLGLSPDESDEILRTLMLMRVLEPGEGPVWRFARLADPPSDAPTSP